MHFVSPVFLLFVPLVFIGWRLLPYAWGKRFMCLANFTFYGYWYPPFLLLLWGFGLLDYWISHRIVKTRFPRGFLLLSIVANLAGLFYFKYTNFFIDALADGSALAGHALSLPHIDVVLPIGISFYIFQSLGYVFDVYLKRIEPCRKPVDYFFYLSFFPHLVAGPILRAHQFLPQLHHKLKVSAADIEFFVYRVSRGFFLKMVVADNLAPYVEAIFAAGGSPLGARDAWLGALLFAVQILCDFAGYSDIAIGCARLFGISIPENFRNPYFAIGFQDFWRRWHISLSSWFRDYLYIPLGGSRGSPSRTVGNTLATFLTSGFWHGANWTFLAWGGIHGLCLIIEKAVASAAPQYRPTRPMARGAAWLATAVVVVLAWVPFRTPSIAAAIPYWQSMFAGSGPLTANPASLLYFGIFISYSIYIYLKEEQQRPALQNAAPFEIPVYVALCLVMPGASTDFIYFQF